MGIADLSKMARVFGRKELGKEEKQDLYKEVVLMTLARATSADTNVHPVEVETVQSTFKSLTGEDVSAADIRLASGSALYETAPLGRYLSRAAGKLNAEERVSIVRALAEVIRSDVRISPFERDFFNNVAVALKLTPSELVGL